MVETRRNIIVYPGFFDPFTLGHLNIVERSAKFFDQVVVSVAESSPKKALFTIEERKEMIRVSCKPYPNVSVESFSGLLVNYLNEKNIRIILRGLRTVSDFEYEFQMSLANQSMSDSIETFFVMTDSKYSHISSTLIKEIVRLGGNVDQMVPEVVRKKMEDKTYEG